MYSNDIINSLNSIDGFTFYNEITEYALQDALYPLVIQEDETSDVPIIKDEEGAYTIDFGYAMQPRNKLLIIYYDIDFDNFQIYQVPEEDIDLDNRRFTFKTNFFDGVFIFLFF